MTASAGHRPRPARLRIWLRTARRALCSVEHDLGDRARVRRGVRSRCVGGLRTSDSNLSICAATRARCPGSPSPRRGAHPHEAAVGVDERRPPRAGVDVRFTWSPTPRRRRGARAPIGADRTVARSVVLLTIPCRCAAGSGADPGARPKCPVDDEAARHRAVTPAGALDDEPLDGLGGPPGPRLGVERADVFQTL